MTMKALLEIGNLIEQDISDLHEVISEDILFTFDDFIQPRFNLDMKYLLLIIFVFML